MQSNKLKSRYTVVHLNQSPLSCLFLISFMVQNLRGIFHFCWTIIFSNQRGLRTSMKRFGRVVAARDIEKEFAGIPGFFPFYFRRWMFIRLSVYPLIFDHQSFRRQAAFLNDDGAIIIPPHLTTNRSKPQKLQSKQANPG